jgi:flagellar biogenesis protein FliO
MPMIRFALHNPWIPFLLWGMISGVCLFQCFEATPAFALEPNSSLFDQSQPSATGKEKAAQPLALQEESTTPPPGVWDTFFRLVFSLGLTVGLIIAVIWCLKLAREKWGWNNRTEEGKPIRVLTSTYLSPRKAIYLVEVGNRILVVGSGNDEICCLDVIEDPGEIEILRQAAQQNFARIFNQIHKQQETVERVEETKKMIEEGKQIVDGYVEKLKNISNKRKNDEGRKT